MNFSLPFLLLLTHITLAAFISDAKTCWKRNCITRNDAGTICLEADYNGIAPSKCADPFLQTLIDKHHTSKTGRSISYYDETADLLGAATWRVPSPLSFPVFVCMTGQRLDDPTIDRTICRHALHDNDMEDHNAHIHECVVERPSTPQVNSCNRGPYIVVSPTEKTHFWDQPVATGIIWVLGGLVTLGAIYVALKWWGGAFARWVRARWLGRHDPPALPLHARNLLFQLELARPPTFQVQPPLEHN